MEQGFLMFKHTIESGKIWNRIGKDRIKCMPKRTLQTRAKKYITGVKFAICPSEGRVWEVHRNYRHLKVTNNVYERRNKHSIMEVKRGLDGTKLVI